MKQIMTDKEKIMEWVRARSGRPQKIDYPDAELDTVGIRINFPGSEDDVYVSEGQSLQTSIGMSSSKYSNNSN